MFQFYFCSSLHTLSLGSVIFFFAGMVFDANWYQNHMTCNQTSCFMGKRNSYWEFTWLWWAWGFPGGASGKEPTCQCRGHKRRRFDPWVGKIPWRRKQQPIPVFLLGEFHGQGSLVCCSPWGRKDLDTILSSATELIHILKKSLNLCKSIRINGIKW